LKARGLVAQAQFDVIDALDFRISFQEAMETAERLIAASLD